MGAGGVEGEGGGLTGFQFLNGGCCERGDEIFQGGCSFYIKNKLRSEILNNKFIYKQIYLSLS